MKTTNLKNQVTVKLHQHKVKLFSTDISFLFLHLPILRFSADNSQDTDDNRDKFTCIYCMKDFAKRNYLLNHVHKNKKCKAKHKESGPYTNANFHRRNDRPFKCKFPSCNGSYATERNRDIHYNRIHGLWKSDPSIKKGGLPEAVCRFPPNRKKQSQSKLKGNNLYTYCIIYRKYQFVISIANLFSTYSLILIIQVNQLQQETTHPLPR